MSDADPSQPRPQPTAGPLQAPRGTRDFYPEDFARRKFVFDAWRSASLRHGFDEIDGPTFEHLDLYTRKSGEGIVSELFSFKRFGGETDFALRPEFTPTLARMVATKANALPKPIKWFSIGSYFRAERPQRGRLREFVQWNCDILGDDGTPEGRARADAECIACCVELFSSLGLTSQQIRIKVNHRQLLESRLTHQHLVQRDRLSFAIALIDTIDKIDPGVFKQKAISSVGVATDRAEFFHRDFLEGASRLERPIAESRDCIEDGRLLQEWNCLVDALSSQGLESWCDYRPKLARGLAYYTGAVFEVHEASGAERAIAGGGRYDNLVELFGGPPTPAVGFAMGDVVLSLVLEDKDLLPSGAELRRRIGAAPDVFVISNGKEESDAQLQPLLAALRREGLHARRSYKSTKNVGKLLKDAADAGARTVAIIEGADAVTLKDLASPGAQSAVKPADLPGAVASIVHSGV